MKKKLIVPGINDRAGFSGVLYFLIFQSALFSYGQSLENPYVKQNSVPFKCITGKYETSIKASTDVNTSSLYNSRNMTNVPVKFYVVRQSNGTGGLTVSEVADELTKLNTLYQNGNIHFFECSPMQYINSDTYNALEAYGNEDQALMQIYNLPNIVNIYFVESITIDGTTDELCGYAEMLPYSTEDFMAVVNDCARWGLLTTCHEMGHYLSLLHTQGSGGPQELVNGSNCATTGDYVCDTPADTYTNTPSSPVDANCNYNGTATDPNGQPYTPLMNNIMSAMTYGDCWTSFTAGQFVRANDCLINDRYYLQCSGTTSVLEQNDDEQKIFTDISSNLLTIKCYEEFSNVSFFDSKGQLISIPTHINVKKTQEELLLPVIASGVYYIRLKVGDKWMTKKIVKID